MGQERVVRFSVRTVLAVIGLVIAAWALLTRLSVTRQVITWILVALFLALALNPAVEWFMRHGDQEARLCGGFDVRARARCDRRDRLRCSSRRSSTRSTTSSRRFPGYVDDLTKGRGRLGFLETKYHIVEKIREQVNKGGASKVLGLTGAAISITKSVISLVVATITIAFLTFFMLLEGPIWMERIYGLLPERLAAALARGRPRRLPDGRRLRDRQPR